MKESRRNYNTNNRQRRSGIPNRSSRFIPSSLIISIAFLILFSSIIMFKFVNVNANKSSSVSMKKQYVSIQIQEGDSLWSLAKEHMGPVYSSLNEYIKDIERVNDLDSDTIHAGCYLIIPQYVAVK